MAACAALRNDRDLVSLSKAGKGLADPSTAYSIVLLCSDDPSHGWAFALARSIHPDHFERSKHLVGYGTALIEVRARNSANARASERVAVYRARESAEQRSRDIEQARPPLLAPAAEIAPEGYVWPDGSKVTSAQISAILVTDIVSKVPFFAPYLPPIFSRYEQQDLDEIGKIPVAFAKRNDFLAAQVDVASRSAAQRGQERASTPAASFEGVAAFIARLGTNVADLSQTKAGYGPVARLDGESACAKAIFESVSKLARNHETMVLRPQGNSLDYFKDQYRALFFAKNIVAMNANPDPEYGEFKVTDGHGTKRQYAVAIVPNAACTSAYVRMIYFGATTNRTKFYALSSARVDAAFLTAPNQGRVSQQYFVYEFLKSTGRPADFSYSCDEDTCSRRK